MVERTPGSGTWLALAAVTQQGSEEALASAYWSLLWSRALEIARPAPAIDPVPTPAPDAANPPASYSADSAPDAAPATSAAALPGPEAAASSTTVTPSGNQYIDGVLSGFAW